MAYQKVFENQYHELPQSTKYRFAEMEISRLINVLLPIYHTKPKTVEAIFNLLEIEDNIQHEKEADFFEMANSHFFNRPERTDEIRQVILYGQSYAKIRQLTKASFNTIASLRYGLPMIHPIYQHWTPEILHRWETIKTSFNIYNEALVHSPKKGGK